MSATILPFPKERARKASANPSVALSPAAFMCWPLVLGTAMGAAAVAAMADQALLLSTAKDRRPNGSAGGEARASLRLVK